MTTTVTNPFQACMQVLIKPNGVFETLVDAKNWSWIPFILVSVATVVLSYIYFGIVDIELYSDGLVNAMPFELPQAQVDALKAATTPDSLKLDAYLSPLNLILISALVAGYLFLATKGDEENVNGFLDWFGFTWWISLPVVINAILAIAIISINNDPQMPASMLSPTSLAFVFGLTLGDNWFALLQNVSLVTLWSIYLTAVGINKWTDLGSKKATIIAILPYAIIGGGWLIYKLV